MWFGLQPPTVSKDDEDATLEYEYASYNASFPHQRFFYYLDNDICLGTKSGCLPQIIDLRTFTALLDTLNSALMETQES